MYYFDNSFPKKLPGEIMAGCFVMPCFWLGWPYHGLYNQYLQNEKSKKGKRNLRFHYLQIIILLLFACGCQTPPVATSEAITLHNHIEVNLVNGTELDLIYRPEFIMDYISKLEGDFILISDSALETPDLFLKGKFTLINGELQFSRWGMGSVIAKSYILRHNSKPYMCTATVNARSVQITRNQHYYALFEIIVGSPQITAIYTYGVKLRINKTDDGDEILEVYEADLPLKVFDINSSDYIDKQTDYNPQSGLPGWWNTEK